jgi:hypothetical protein
MLLRWRYYTKWTGATSARLTREMRKDLDAAFPGRTAVVLCRDNDPTGFESNANLRSEDRCNFIRLRLPKRSPDLMPWDFHTWHWVLSRSAPQT